MRVSKSAGGNRARCNGHFKILGVENWLVILNVFCFFPGVHGMFLDGWFFTAPTRYELLVNMCHVGEEANALSLFKYTMSPWNFRGIMAQPLFSHLLDGYLHIN